METNELLEGKKTDNLEGTSTSEEIKSGLPAENGAEQNVPDLATTPIPTEEEVKDASLEVKPEEIATPSEPEPEAPVQSEAEPTEVISTENVAVEENPTEPAQTSEENGVTELGPATKVFTQSQVNELVGNTRTETREKTFRYIYDRYGVKDEAELDELVGNAQALDSFKEKYDTERAGWKQTSADRDKELQDVKEQVALLQSGIDSDRFEDAKFILRGKGLEVSLDNIKNELATHPEWQKKDSPAEQGNPNFAKTGEGTMNMTKPTEPSSKISVLGNENTGNANPENAEEDYALSRMFKV